MTDDGLANELRVFVYGTLKPGQRYWKKLCEGRVTTAMPAKVRGELVTLDLGYPALLAVPAQKSAAALPWAHGYVLCLPDAALLRELDALEEFDPFLPPDVNDYNRIPIDCFDPGGEPFLRAWGYVMDPEKAAGYGARPTPRGIWNGPAWE